MSIYKDGKLIAGGITAKSTASFTSYTPSNDSKNWVVYGKAA